MEVHPHLKGECIFIQQYFPADTADLVVANFSKQTRFRKLMIDKIVVDTTSLFKEGKVPVCCHVVIRMNNKIMDTHIEKMTYANLQGSPVGVPLPLIDGTRSLYIFPAPWVIFRSDVDTFAQNISVGLYDQDRPLQCDAFAIWLHYE